MTTEPIGKDDAISVSENENQEKPIEASLTLAKPKKPRKKQATEKMFSNALVVRRENGQKLLVPVSGSDNKAANQIMASMVRDLVKQNIDLYKESGMALKPKELADLATAAKLAAELSYDAYIKDDDGVPSSANHPPADGPVSGLITGMRALGRGMMEGAIESPKGISSLMAELDALGKKGAKKAEKTAEVVSE